MPDKKYLIEIPGMPEGSGVWEADKWERNKDAFMADYPDANVFEVGAYDANDSKDSDQIMLTFEGDELNSGIWDSDKWERNKDVFMQDYPDAIVNRVRHVDYWGAKADENRARKAQLQQPDEERNARLAELGYYDDITGGQVQFDLNSPTLAGLKPLSSVIEDNKVSGEAIYHDPRVQEFFINDTATTERMAEIARLDEEYESNPSVIAYKEWLAEKQAADAAYASELEKKIKQDMGTLDSKLVGMGRAGSRVSAKYGMTPYIPTKEETAENEKYERYTSALKLLQQAQDAREVAGKGFAGGVGDVAKDLIRSTGTQSDVDMYNEVGDILSRLEKKVGNLNEVSEEDIEKNLSSDEQALVRAFFEYNSAMAEAGNDMSTWYKGGKIFAESVPFIIEFLATGGVYSGAGKVATRGLMRWVASAAKGTAKRAARKAVVKATKGAVSAFVGTAARTAISPGTYDRMAESSVAIDKNGHLNRVRNAKVAAVDMYIENLSEISGKLISKGLGLIGKGAGWAIGKTPLSKIGNLLADNRLMQQISKAWGSFMPKLEALGFHGLPEEVGEEFIGNTLRDVFGVQPGALSEMVEDDNFGAMLIGFAPMTLFGAAGSAAQIGVINYQAANLGNQIRDSFLNLFDNEQIDHMMASAQNGKSSDEIWQAIKPFVASTRRAAEEGKISTEDAEAKIEMLYQYGGFMAQNNALLFAKKQQDKQLADAKRTEMTNTYGRFWQENESEDVQVAELNDGRTVFITSTPNENGEVAIIDVSTGRKGFANTADIATEEKDGEVTQKSNTMTMDAFLDIQIASERKTAEEVRMSNERNAQIEALASEIVPGKTEINLGTEGSPILVLASGVARDGVRVIGQDGVESIIGWDQTADALGKPIIVKTDEQIADEYVAARAAELAERRKARNSSPATEIATQQTAEQTNEIAAAENVHIPMNEDGTVNEAAFWEQNPEEYVKWNDEQNQDGGQDSLQQVAIAKQELMKMLSDAQNAQATSNPTVRKAAKAEAERLADRILRLDAIEQSYAQALAQEQEAVKQTQATPTAAMSEEDLVKMDEQYQGILGKTRVLSERVRVMQEYLDKLAENSVPVVLLTKENYEKRMQEEGAADYLIDMVREQVDAGEKVAGFMAAGKVYLMEEGLDAVEDARVTYVHERQHTFNRENPQLVQRVANALGSEENAIAILKIFVGERGVSAYANNSLEALADEIICRSMEIAYSTEEISVDLQSRGIPSEVISIIAEIDNEQRQDQNLAHARRRGGRNSHAGISGAGSMREDGRNLEQVSGGLLGQEGSRPSEISERGAQVREGAEVEDGSSLRVTPEMDAEYLAAVEAGDMDKAQQMVLEAAKLAMPNTKVVDENGNPMVVYHGTSGAFTKFEENRIGQLDPGYFGRGFYFTPDKSMSEGYAKAAGGDVVMGVFLNITNPIETDMNNTSLFGDRLDGHDGAIVRLGEPEFVIGETNGNPYEIIEIVAKNSNQIKSADPVTYDNDGNIIPLSKRFNFEEEDIRFRVESKPEDNLSEETKQELADKGLVMEGGVIMSDDYAELKQETGYLTPIEEGATTDDVRFSVVTMPGWRQNYLKYQDADKRVVRVLEAFADRITANELVNGVIAQGKHKSSKKTKDGRLVETGPLRSNISYVVTFDLDTTCPRTFQYLNYVKRIERRIGRPLTQIECIQLNEMMRMYGQQIPCVYCYAENKRQAMKQYFNNYIASRHAVLSAETDEEALKHMYGHEAEGTDPKAVLTEAAYKVFKKWRKNPKGTYNPTMRVLWHQYDQARNSVLSLLDMRYEEGVIKTDAADNTLAKMVAGELGVSNKTAVRAIEEIVVEWKWNTIEGVAHDDFTRMDEDDLWANENALEVWRDMTLYAKSASGAKNVNRYVPYTDELKNVDQATRDYINGMGGLRMHSTNDFRIDYVFDYFQFLADMAAAKMFGHTYTKSPEFVRIFGNSGYKINMSIAAYQDENGVIRPNVDEGFDWNEAKELRRLFPNAGTMLMATSDEQLQMALDSDWIDMCIPFHHSGLPKAVWYNMRLWTDYTTVQNERFFNNDERIAMLAEAGVELPKKISTENVEEIFNEHFGIKVEYGTDGKRVKPHFLPGPTIVKGVKIPGHNNDHQEYLRLCKMYGVKPRFEGIKVKDNTPEGGGRIVDITEHPRYMILVKETARTDTPQAAIQFNFDQPSEALGGKSPMDYAFDELEARAMAESDLAGGKVRDIYTSLKQDQFGIVEQFLNTIIKHKEETGEDYPMDYLTPESREWFLVQRKAFEEAFKDIETIPYHRNEYDEQGNLTKGKGLEREETIDLVEEAKKAQAKHDEKPSLSFRFAPRTDEQREQMFDAAKTEFGTAKKFKTAGYMLPDGSLLDFSEEGNRTERSLDHRAIARVMSDRDYESRYDYIVDFMNEGGIRVIPEFAGLQMTTKPSEQQEKMIWDFIYTYDGEIILQIDDENGGQQVYMEYDRRTPASKIFRDINGYFNEGVVPEMRESVSFRIANENQAIFISNAAKAVEGIKQEKATPEQWLKMIEKNGGLKAGEDKWMGLSDWLKASDKKTLTKQEVLQFINDNMIVIEEQHYSNSETGRESVKILNEKFPNWEEAFSFDWDGYMEEPYASIWDNEVAVGLYNNNHEDQIELDEDGEFADFDAEEKVKEFGNELAEIYYGSESVVRAIHGTREDYTSQGLTNLHEIALTVPTIESWGAHDMVHFGDAGEGRAVAWIRFGDASKWVSEKMEDGKKGRNQKVLVIDEIQSKRHQEGREKGYMPNLEKEYERKEAIFLNAQDAYINYLKNAHGVSLGSVSQSEIESLRAKDAKLQDLWEVMKDAEGDLKDVGRRQAMQLSDARSVPDAPFDKNWHELAMKRMLRYAAENGYGVIAWTKGEQQAERYNIGSYVSSIEAQEEFEMDGVQYKDFGFYMGDSEDAITVRVDEEGKVVYAEGHLSQAEGRPLSDLVGKELAVEMMQLEQDDYIEGGDLKVGNEGMKGFYDKMLPAFMNKYGKKWGIKVEDIELPNLENGLTMHSVPVTEEMKASVMEGQVMFRVTDESVEVYEDALSEYKSKYNEVAPMSVVDIRSRKSLADALGVSVEELGWLRYFATRLAVLRGMKGAYAPEYDRIVIFANNSNLDKGSIENKIFHEAIHKVTKENPQLLELGMWMWDNLDTITANYARKAIKGDYDEAEYADEMVSSVVSTYMSIGKTQHFLGYLPDEHKANVELIFNTIGYESEREDRERDLRRKQRNDRGLAQEQSAGRSVEKEPVKNQQEGETKFRTRELTLEERAFLNEYFPGMSISFRIDSNGNKLTPAQEEFFANSKAVDKEGNLLALYHGTPRAGFTEFKSGWFTTSKEDAISYSGDRKGRMFDPNEKYEAKTIEAGDYPLGYMTFDSEEDRTQFLERFPYAAEVMSERDYESARLSADEEYDELTARRDEFAEVWNAYREYERGRFVDSTINDLLSNPEAYTEDDFRRAILAYDSNAYLDEVDEIDDTTERKSALVDALNYMKDNAAENGGDILDMKVTTRVPRNGSGVVHNDTNARTYEVYANVEKPYEIDAKGRSSEFESGDVYDAVRDALANDQYDGVIIRNWRVGRHQQLGDVVVPKKGSQIKLTRNENPDKGVGNVDENGVSFRVVTDQNLLDQLDSEEYISLYRAMQIHNGGLYQPMAGKVAYKEGEEATWGDPIPEQTWLQSDETPWNAIHARYDKDTKDHKKGDLKYDKDGNPVWVFKLNKGNGKSLYANYNPYIHTSFSPLNDQFSEAQDRDNLVVVRVLVPKSELTSGYKAEKAHDAVGTMPWHSGPISGVLAQYEGKERVVMLTRYAKIDGIVPWAEVADDAMSLFEGTELLNNPLPTNVFMPGLREELEKRGVQFVKTNNGGVIKEGPDKGKTWASVYGKDGLGKKPKDSEVRFRFSPATDEIDLRAMRGISTLRAFNVSFQEMRKIFYDVAEEAEKTIMQLREKQNRTAYDEERLARAEKDLKAAHRKIAWWESVNSQLIDTTPYEPTLKEDTLDLEPRTPAEFISQFLTMHMVRVNKVSVDENGKAVVKKVNRRAGITLTKDTLKRELGWDSGDWAGIKYIVSESEGKNLDEIAEMISEDAEAQSIFAGMDVMEIKNEIIDFLQSVRNYAEIRDFVVNERKREAEEYAAYVNGRIEATVDQIESSMGMTVDEYNGHLIKEELKDIDRVLAEVETSKIYGKFETLTNTDNEAYQRSLLEGAERGIQEGDQTIPDYGDGAMDSAVADNNEPQRDSRGEDTGDVGDRAGEAGGSGIPPIGRKGKGLVQEPMELSSESASVDEVVSKGRQKAIDENLKAGEIYSEKIQRLNNSLAKLRSALAAQREYDVNTVKIVTGLANELLQIGRLTDMSRSEIKRLLSVIKDATGKEDLSLAVERLMDIMIANQLRSGKTKVEDLMKVKASKVNASGVEVRGSLDVAGQQMMLSLKEGIAPTMTDDVLAERIAIEENNLDSDSAVIRGNAENRLAGYYLARQYREDILASEAEEKALRKEIADAKEQYDAKRMDKTAYKEFIKSCYDAIRENRMQRVTAYEEFANKVTAKLAGSIVNAKLLNEAEKARVEQIHHFANSDMQGMPSVQQGNVKSVFWNNPILRFLFKPLATFDQMLRSFAPKSRYGEGYLWNHFMGGWIKATEEEFKGIQAAHEKLDEKVRTIFPEARRWSDLFSIEKKMPKMQVKFWDGEKMADFELTQGNLLYIYMVNKMTDGQMKLRKMDITDADVIDIARELDPRFLELADWIQNEFLPGLREKYNSVHEKLFGAPMAAIDNYFPIRVLANARTREVDLGVEESSGKPSTITGNIIKRTKNSLALDILGSDAFDVVLEHIEEMEKWAAFAGFNKDLNTLLSYNKFRNRVQNMKGIYGAGTTVWNNFRATAEIAAGVYKPAVKSDSLDKMITNIAKGVTGAKISFRVYTALKQFLSAPAFVSDASPVELMRALSNPYKAWKWAMSELPVFEKRWKSRQAGDSRLMETEADWELWKSKVVELAGRYGMTPNAFVDALTVSMGAKAIYETKLKEYLKNGYSQERAEEKAKRDATVLFNESQQSNEAAFLSSAQVDRTVASILVTVFRNSSMGYQRMYVDALRNIKHMLKKGYKAESIEFMTKQMVRDGLTEAQATRAAERIYNRSLAKNAVRVATFGFLVQFAWNLGPYMAYLLMGDDDDEKKDMITDAAVRGFVGGPVEGLAAGQALSSVIGDAVRGEKVEDPTLKLPATSDMETIFNQLDKDPVRAINDIFNLVIQSGIGVNPQTISDAVVAIVDACNGDMETSKEVAFALMRILQTPQSQIEKLYMEEIDFTAEEALDMSIKEFAERYAKYKVTRNAPLSKWMYSDDKEKELENKYIKNFTKKAEELQRSLGTEEAKEFFEYYDNDYADIEGTIRDLAKQIRNAAADEDLTEEQKAEQELDKFLESEEFKKYERIAAHIKAYEAYKKALKDAKPEDREEFATEMLKERNAAVDMLRKEND